MDYFTTKARAQELGFPIKEFADGRHRHPRPYSPINLRCGAYSPERIWLGLTQERLEQIIEHFENDADFYDVGVQGLPSNTEVGSKRITAYDEGFAKFLTGHLMSSLRPEIMDDFSPVDWQSQNPEKLNYWVPLGISPVFRYMRYREGSQHYVHYDAPHIHADPTIRTLKSGVLYLTDSLSCRTAFVDDGQGHLPFVERNHSDWDRETHPEEISESYCSEAGAALLFHHQIPHFVTKHTGFNDRIIIRFDVTYKAVGKI